MSRRAPGTQQASECKRVLRKRLAQQAAHPLPGSTIGWAMWSVFGTLNAASEEAQLT